MEINLGVVDRIVRIAVALVLSALYFTGTVEGLWGVVLLSAGGVLLLTAALGRCGLYSIFGVNTCKVRGRG